MIMSVLFIYFVGFVMVATANLLLFVLNGDEAERSQARINGRHHNPLGNEDLERRFLEDHLEEKALAAKRLVNAWMWPIHMGWVARRAFGAVYKAYQVARSSGKGCDGEE